MAPPSDPQANGRGDSLLIAIFLLHPGYVRYYRPVIELLASRGHRIHLAFALGEKDPGDMRLVEEIEREHPGISSELAPARARSDRWRAPAGLIRSLIDVARYSHPRYREAPRLRARVGRKIRQLVTTGSAGGAITRPISLLLVRFVERPRSARAADRLVAALLALEKAVPTSREIDAYVRRLSPDVVLATPVIDFGSPLVDYLKSAARLGIPNGVCVASWDNLTGKGLLRVVPDRVFVWNEIQRREATEMHRIPADRVVATGAPKFDEWFVRRPRQSPAEFAQHVGLPADQPYLLYLCSSSFIAPDEADFVADWLERLRADPRLSDLGVLVRPHPQNAAQWADADLSRFAPIAIWPRGGAQPDSGDARAEFFESLAHCAAVVGVNTSALIESAILGKSAFTVLDSRFAGTQEGTLHFHYLRAENGGFLHEARSWEEHLEQLKRALDGGEREATRAFVERFVRPRGLDRPAAPILSEEIEALAELADASRTRRRGRTRLLRTLNAPARVRARSGMEA